VSFVEDDEVIGKQHSAAAAFLARAAGAQMGEEEAMIDDDDLRVPEPGTGPLVEAVFAAAILMAAG
jgi:hypothetical protein